MYRGLGRRRSSCTLRRSPLAFSRVCSRTTVYSLSVLFFLYLVLPCVSLCSTAFATSVFCFMSMPMCPWLCPILVYDLCMPVPTVVCYRNTLHRSRSLSVVYQVPGIRYTTLPVVHVQVCPTLRYLSIFQKFRRVLTERSIHRPTDRPTDRRPPHPVGHPPVGHHTVHCLLASFLFWGGTSMAVVVGVVL